MSFYLITPANWNRCIRQASTRSGAAQKFAIECPGKDFEVELLGPARLATLKGEGLRLPTDALVLVKAWKEAEARRAAKSREANAGRDKARRAAEKAREVQRETEKATRAATREVAQKARDAAKRATLREEWRVAAEAAVARGEPFKDREEQRVYMQGMRSLAWRAKREALEKIKATAGPELVPNEGGDRDDSAPW